VTLELTRRLAVAHGVLAWVAALALAAATIRLTRGRPGAPLLRAQAAVTTTLATLAFASGALLELPYRVHLRQRLFLASRGLGWLFERKLHLAFGALVFAWCALAVLLAAQIAHGTPPVKAKAVSPDPQVTARLVRASCLAYAVAALFALVACAASSIVAAKMRF
jgi:hypothetical protein